MCGVLQAWTNIYLSGQKIDGHVYYYFPIGTSLLITPLVYAENLLGLQAYKNNNDANVQKIAVMGITFLILLMTYLIARRFYPPVWSAALSAFTFFGTLVGPTVGTALWSIDFEVLFTSVTILMLLKVIAGEYGSTVIPGLVLGLILFSGFLVRPTFAVIIVAAFWILYIRNKPLLLFSGAISGILLVAFMVYCHIEIGSILPPYYLLSRLSTVNALHALFGLLFSPSRSIFVFTPALILLPLLTLLCRKKTEIIYSVLAKVFIGVMLALFFLNVFFPHWDAGWSYGPRILTGMSFIGVIILIISVGTINDRKRRHIASMLLGILLFLGCLVDISGMYNIYTLEWNAYPRLGINMNYIVWDYEYPQPLMDRKMLIQKCYVQTQHLKISPKLCLSLGPPNPGTPFATEYRRYFDGRFNASPP